MIEGNDVGDGSVVDVGNRTVKVGTMGGGGG